MRAAIMHERNGTPVIEDVPEPDAPLGTRKIKVASAGLKPTDLMRARGVYKVPATPYIIGGEGVGYLNDGTRVYFGQSIPSSGAFGEWTIVPEQEVWPLPDWVEDGQAIALGTAGTGALIPMEEARVAHSDQVLILGATGPVGQVAMLAARALGASRIVAAARTSAALERLQRRGLADGVVVLGSKDDAAALWQASDGGFDVALDLIYGAPAEAALMSLRNGGKLVSIGVHAGETMTVPLRALVRKTHMGVSTGDRSVAERRATYDRLLGHAQEKEWRIDTTEFRFADVASAWKEQQGSPGGKVVVRVGTTPFAITS